MCTSTISTYLKIKKKNCLSVKCMLDFFNMTICNRHCAWSIRICYCSWVLRWWDRWGFSVQGQYVDGVSDISHLNYFVFTNHQICFKVHLVSRHWTPPRTLRSNRLTLLGLVWPISFKFPIFSVSIQWYLFSCNAAVMRLVRSFNDWLPNATLWEKEGHDRIKCSVFSWFYSDGTHLCRETQSNSFSRSSVVRFDERSCYTSITNLCMAQTTNQILKSQFLIKLCSISD